MLKRIVIRILKAIAFIAAIIVFGLHFNTGIQVLIFAAALIIGLICVAVYANLDDETRGYWPEPLNWGKQSDRPDIRLSTKITTLYLQFELGSFFFECTQAFANVSELSI